MDSKLLKSAAMGNADDQIALAAYFIYERQDLAEGLKWIQRAAQSGSYAGEQITAQLKDYLLRDEVRSLITSKDSDAH